MIIILIMLLISFGTVLFCIFFDQAILIRKNFVFNDYKAKKVVALTFDDGPSLAWTPKILDELKKVDIKATFFMLGKHVKKYPEIARRVAQEGHEIGNHSYNHDVLIYYEPEEIVKEITDTEQIIKETTGFTMRYFRPPKAWLTNRERRKIEDLGYTIILWSLNSKDWVTFHNKYIVKYLVHNIRLGDIILFHDSGGVFSTEGGDRSQTVKTIPRLVKKLTEKGYKFVTISELLNTNEQKK